MYTYVPADNRGLGGGVYMGLEIRHRFLQEFKGSFAGIYIGFGGQLYEDESDDLAFTAAFSLGPKIGWRIPLLRGRTDIDIETADIALMNDDISRIPFLTWLGRRTMLIIKLNIAFGLVFNALAVLASGGGMLTPIMGALVHNIGSVLVVLSSASIAFIRER